MVPEFSVSSSVFHFNRIPPAASAADDMYVIDREGEPHRGAAALKYLSRHLRPLWPLAPLLHIPGTLPIWQWCYQQIARRRYLWGRADECDSGSCRVHFKASGESERNSRTNSKNEA